MSSQFISHQRREILKGAGFFGLSAALPPLLASCGGGSSNGATLGTAPASTAPEVRETRHLHFDLSMAPIAEPKLFALRSQHHGVQLQAHTNETRQQHRSMNPALANVPDAKLTHFLADVDVAGNALQSVMVMGTDPKTGAPVLGGIAILAPRSALKTVAARRAAQNAAAPLSAKRRAYGISGTADDPSHDVNAFSTPWDVAIYLVFHHPAVMNLKPDLGADILQRIENLPCAANDPSCTPYLATLAYSISLLITQKGYPSTTPGSWATLVAQTRADGTPLLDKDGKPVYRFDVDEKIAEATGSVVTGILQNINDDPLFKGTNWHETQGIASRSAKPASVALTVSGDGSFNVSAGSPVGSTISGIEMVALTVADAASRKVRLTVRNTYLRYLSVYVQYLDANGNAARIDSPGTLDTFRSQYLQMVGSNDQIMGIPFQGKNVATTDIEFSVPATASEVKIYFGSLGLGGDSFTPEAIGGAASTLALNIGLPTMMLAAGVFIAISAGPAGLFLEEATLKNFLIEILKSLKESGIDIFQGIYNSATARSWQGFVVAMANVAIQALLSVSPALVAVVFAQVLTEEQIDVAFPLVAIPLRILAFAAAGVEVGFCVDEVSANPAITTNIVSLSMNTTVRIGRDPRDYQFPASATKYKVEATYDGGKTPVVAEGVIAPGLTGPVDVLIPNVPSGGMVSIKVMMYSDTGCLVGLKQTDPIRNLPETAGLIPVEIVELVAPLTPDTRYQHTLKLGYANGARTWSPAPAPEFTRNNLCQGADGAICALNGLTVHTASGMAGYGFNAGGQNVSNCGGGSSNGALNTVQNAFLGQNPDQGLKFSGCGTTQPMGIVYDPQGPVAGGNHFFVQPAADGFHLRSVQLDAATPFNMNQTTSWGRFTTALDSLAVVPSGYVVGVNRQTHKMEILLLPQQPIDQAYAPNSVPFASVKAGLGKRAGLLDTPVAVAASAGGILVLEQGNTRVQAFDCHANPVPIFKGGTTSLMPLVPDEGAIYLDVAVEGLGYMYVLSYITNGLLPEHYRLDLYTPNGDFLNRTLGVAAARLAVDLFRNVYTLNYEPLVGSPRVEPSLSQWLPKTGNVCPSTLPTPPT